MILFKDILKDIYEQLTQESDYTDADLNEIPVDALTADDLKDELQEHPKVRLKEKHIHEK